MSKSHHPDTDVSGCPLVISSIVELVFFFFFAYRSKIKGYCSQKFGKSLMARKKKDQRLLNITHVFVLPECVSINSSLAPRGSTKISEDLLQPMRNSSEDLEGQVNRAAAELSTVPRKAPPHMTTVREWEALLSDLASFRGQRNTCMAQSPLNGKRTHI